MNEVTGLKKIYEMWYENTPGNKNLTFILHSRAPGRPAAAQTKNIREKCHLCGVTSRPGPYHPSTV